MEITDIKAKLQEVTEENERLYAELHKCVEEKIRILPRSGSEVDDVLVRNLREQLQLSEQEREQATDLWEMTVMELISLQAEHQRTITAGQEQEVQQQQLQDQLAQWQSQAQRHQLANQTLKSSLQQLLITVNDQTAELSELFSQYRQSQAEHKTAEDELSSAKEKMDEMDKRLQWTHQELKKQEEDAAKALCQQEAAERRLQQFQLDVSQMEIRMKVACEERDGLLRERTTWEEKMGELLERCACLQQDNFEAAAKVREAVQIAEEALLQEHQAVLRDKLRTEMLERLQESVRQQVEEAVDLKRKELENVQQDNQFKVSSLTEEVSTLQLECTKKDLLIERFKRDMKNVEAELEKMRKKSEADVRKTDGLQQRCLLMEQSKVDLDLTLEKNQRKLGDMEKDYSEKLSQLQEEVRRLQGCLDADRRNSAKVSEEHQELQQENEQLRTQLMELRKSTTVAAEQAKLKYEKQLAASREKISLLQSLLTKTRQKTPAATQTDCKDGGT